MLSWRLARAPGWEEMRRFALVSLSAGLYCLFDSVITTGVSEDVITWSSRLSMVAGAFHGPGWVLYLAAQERRPARLWEKGVLAAGATLAALSLVPGVIITDAVRYHSIPWLGVTYADAQPSTFGAIAYGIYCTTLLLPLVVYVRAAIRRVPAAGAHAAGLTCLSLAAINDSLVGAGVLSTPYLLAPGFTAAVVFAGGVMVARFVDQARAHERLSRALESEVERRTHELERAQAALVRAEKLAALGRLTAGAAHEINNPCSIVVANLAYLRESIRTDGKLPHDVENCLEDSLSASERIVRIVRHLVDAGRAGRASYVELSTLSVRPIVEKAVANARIGLPDGLRIRVEGDGDIKARCDPALLGQILVNLVVNAAHAVDDRGEGGGIVARVDKANDGVVVDVIDDGGGIAPKDHERVFEPFFTTKEPGRGMGLGLAVSLGLARAQGGDLVVASTGPKGTTMRIKLAERSVEDTGRGAEPKQTAAVGRRLRILLIDDDLSVLDAMCRQLAAHFEVTAVDGVEAGIAEVRRQPDRLELVLCDVVMADGGGERFAREVTELSPRLAARTIYFTGGIVEDASRQFVDGLGRRAIRKPIKLQSLLQLAHDLVEADGAAAVSQPV